MSLSTATPRNRLWFLTLAVPLLLLAGCVPVLWLPDSSGFLYVSKDGSAMLYEVAGGKKKVLVTKLPADTMWPALSADGKRFAVASLTKKETPKKQYEVRFHVYDLKGKQVHRSASFVWRDADSAMDSRTTAMFWARTRDKLIVHDYQDRGHTGIYDLEKKTFIPVDGMPAMFGGSPIRPDDKGFLITRAVDDKLGLFLVGWDGKEQAIEVDDAIGKEEERLQVVQSPWRGTSSWDNSTALVTFKAWQVRIDTDKRTAKLEKAPADSLDVGTKPVVQRFDFPGKGAKVRVVREKTKDDKPLDRLLLWRPGEKKKPEEVLSVKDGFFILSPSPDGKWLVVRGLGDDVKEFEFLLLSKEGEVRNRP